MPNSEKSEAEIAFISIGSNIGDRLANCKEAIERMDSLNLMSVTDISRFYETYPVDYTLQRQFINCAVKIETNYDPLQLLEKLQEIEKRVGTTKKEIRFGPRILDLDIIFFGKSIIDSERLKIPHPAMSKRHFVLRPLCDIEPEFVHPLLKTDMKGLLKQLKKDIKKSFNENLQKIRLIK